MDEMTAKTVIAAGFAVGTFVWLFGVRLFWKIMGDTTRNSLSNSIDGKSPKEVISGIIARSTPGASLRKPDERTLTARQMGVEVRFEAEPTSKGSTLATELDFTKFRATFLWILGAIVLVLAPLVLIGVTSVLWTVAAPSDKTAIRMQAIQILQIVNVLWPPFLVYFIYTKTRSKIEVAVRDLPLIVEHSQ